MEEKQLLNAISNLMDEKIQPVKEDIRELKEDVSGLKRDVSELKKNQIIMEGKMDRMEQKVNNIEFTIENKIYHEIHLVAESHFFLKRNLDYIESTLEKHSEIPIKVNYLYYEIQRIKRQMAG